MNGRPPSSPPLPLCGTGGCGCTAAFRQQHPGVYSHYVFLDHQDWLAHHAPDTLAEEWALIFADSAPGDFRAGHR